MRKSVLLGDLAQYLAHYAEQLESAGFASLACHFRNDAERLDIIAQDQQANEPPIPTLESLAGSIPDFTGGLSPEEYVRKMRGSLSQ